MAQQPGKEELKTVLLAAGSAHHDYETHYLKGVRDEVWPGWYAAFVIGRLGGFTTPTRLTEMLEATSYDGDWFENAAQLIEEQINP